MSKTYCYGDKAAVGDTVLAQDNKEYIVTRVMVNLYVCDAKDGSVKGAYIRCSRCMSAVSESGCFGPRLYS